MVGLALITRACTAALCVFSCCLCNMLYLWSVQKHSLSHTETHTRTCDSHPSTHSSSQPHFVGLCFALDVRLCICSCGWPAGIHLLFCHIRLCLVAGSLLHHLLKMGIPIWKSGWQVGKYCGSNTRSHHFYYWIRKLLNSISICWYNKLRDFWLRF